ncbi:MAG TPA: VOC family protein [Terriglobales bacterium]|nr:VOC family protein [Terriglobales bacterium]
MPPTTGNGKICYLEIPSNDIAKSAAFYESAFGWHIRTNNEGHTAFDDGVGQVSGQWRKGWPAHTGGITIHIMVDDAAATVEKVVASGGTIIEPVSGPREKFAKFRDPSGNVMGIYQERK